MHCFKQRSNWHVTGYYPENFVRNRIDNCDYSKLPFMKYPRPDLAKFVEELISDKPLTN